jgi:acyl-CoA reductase-like NAD-dependent aldehyde dehydrogenase
VQDRLEPEKFTKISESSRRGRVKVSKKLVEVLFRRVPYAGVGKSGMGGGVVSPETLNDYLRPISVVRPL